MNWEYILASFYGGCVTLFLLIMFFSVAKDVVKSDSEDTDYHDDVPKFI